VCKISKLVEFVLNVVLYRQYRNNMVRSFDEEMKFLDKVSPTCWKIMKGFVPNMKVRYVGSYKHRKGPQGTWSGKHHKVPVSNY